MKYLIVDDSLTMRRILSKAMEDFDGESVEVADGLQALDALAASPDDFGLVLLDWNMPNMDGFEALTKIKGDPNLQHIPVVMVTTEAERPHVVKAIQAGACQYVVKPFEKDALQEKVRKALGTT